MTPRSDRSGALGALAVLCLGVGGAGLLAGCGATAEGGDTTAVPGPAVVDVGALPAPLPSTTSTSTTVADPAADTTAAPTTTLFQAPGNRVLMIGDSILASTSKRYSNDMCSALVPLGWQVEIEAEVSRGIEFGVDVMRARGDADWDVGLVFLGTNYGNDDNAYLRSLNRIIGEFGDVPVVLVTISEFRDEIREVNDVIEALLDVYDNLSIVDWREITAAFPTLLNDDGIHPTPQGREVLAESVALHLGPAPVGPGRCLDSVFTDDSAGSVDGGGSGSSGGSGGGGSTVTTVRPATTTTAKPGTATTTTVKPGTATTTTTGTGSTTPGTGSTTPNSSAPPTSNTTVTTPATTAPATTPTSATVPTITPPPDTTGG